MANITKPSGLSNIWANGGTKIDPGTSKVNLGWVVQLPPYEYQNWVDNRQDQAIAHFSQHGIPEWDSVTEYQGLLSYAQGSDGVIYKCLQTNTNKDPANTLNNLFWAIAFENYGSVALVQAALAAHITNYQTLAGIGNVSGARTNLSVYSKLESDARFAGLNGSAGQVFSVGVATQPQHAVRLSQVSALLVQATESSLGVIKLATLGVAEAGIDDLTAITPLKGAAVYLKKTGNLAGLANVATARTNLGLGTAATADTSQFLQASANLSDVVNLATARSNLGLTSTATQPETYFLRSGQNLSDVANVSAARSNLGLTSTAVTPLASLMLKSDNLAGLASVASARTNLGLGTAATLSATTLLLTANNLSDLTNTQTARNNLGLGNLSTRNVFGVDGDLNFTSVKSQQNGSVYLPGNLLMQWGQGPALGDDGGVVVNLPIQMNIMSVQITGLGAASSGVGPCFLTQNWQTTSFDVYNNYNTGPARPFGWFAIGYV